jgi:hypothetical protein
MKTGRTAAAVDVYQTLENQYRQALEMFAGDKDELMLDKYMHRLFFKCHDHIRSLAKNGCLSAVELFELEAGRACPLK